MSQRVTPNNITALAGAAGDTSACQKIIYIIIAAGLVGFAVYFAWYKKESFLAYDLTTQQGAKFFTGANGVIHELKYGPDQWMNNHDVQLEYADKLRTTCALGSGCAKLVNGKLYPCDPSKGSKFDLCLRKLQTLDKAVNSAGSALQNYDQSLYSQEQNFEDEFRLGTEIGKGRGDFPFKGYAGCKNTQAEDEKLRYLRTTFQNQDQRREQLEQMEESFVPENFDNPDYADLGSNMDQSYYKQLGETIQRGVFSNNFQSGKSFGSLLHGNEQRDRDDRYIYMDSDQQQRLDRAELASPHHQRAEIVRSRNDYDKYPAENEMDKDDDIRAGLQRISEKEKESMSNEQLQQLGIKRQCGTGGKDDDSLRWANDPRYDQLNTNCKRKCGTGPVTYMSQKEIQAYENGIEGTAAEDCVQSNNGSYRTIPREGFDNEGTTVITEGANRKPCGWTGVKNSQRYECDMGSRYRRTPNINGEIETDTQGAIVDNPLVGCQGTLNDEMIRAVARQQKRFDADDAGNQQDEQEDVMKLQIVNDYVSQNKIFDMEDAQFYDENERLLNTRFDPVKEKQNLVANAYKYQFGIDQDQITNQDKSAKAKETFSNGYRHNPQDEFSDVESFAPQDLFNMKKRAPCGPTFGTDGLTQYVPNNKQLRNSVLRQEDLLTQMLDNGEENCLYYGKGGNAPTRYNQRENVPIGACLPDYDPLNDKTNCYTKGYGIMANGCNDRKFNLYDNGTANPPHNMKRNYESFQGDTPSGGLTMQELTQGIPTTYGSQNTKGLETQLQMGGNALADDVIEEKIAGECKYDVSNGDTTCFLKQNIIKHNGNTRPGQQSLSKMKADQMLKRQGIESFENFYRDSDNIIDMDSMPAEYQRVDQENVLTNTLKLSVQDYLNVNKDVLTCDEKKNLGAYLKDELRRFENPLEKAKHFNMELNKVQKDQQITKANIFDVSCDPYWKVMVRNQARVGEITRTSALDNKNNGWNKMMRPLAPVYNPEPPSSSAQYMSNLIYM